MIKKNKNIIVASHPRTGNHWLMYSIWSNFYFKNKVEKYNNLFGCHFPSKKCSIKKYVKRNGLHDKNQIFFVITLFRNLLDTLLSLYNFRERFGIDGSVDFKDFIHTRYKNMKLSEKTNVIWDKGEEQVIYTKVSYILMKNNLSRDFTPVEFWVESMKYWFQNADIIVNYENFKNDPIQTLNMIHNMTGIEIKKNTTIRKDRIGWYSNNDKYIVNQSEIDVLKKCESDFLEDVYIDTAIVTGRV
ncbi:MAG: hypothetical protein ACOC56_03210 [Atribacterota bacterium]